MLVGVVQDATQLFELTLLRRCSGAGMFKLVGELSDPLLCILTAADLFATDPADHEGEGGGKQHEHQDRDGIFCHADFSKSVVACSRSTYSMVARQTR